MSVNALNSSMAGLSANQYRQNVTANNVANVNTPGFQPTTAQPQARPAAGEPAYINDIGRTNAAQQAAATYAPQRPAAAAAPASAQPAAPQSAPTAMTQAAPTTAAPQMSNVDMITETANRMNAQNAYNLNIPAAQTMNQMSQTLMDIRG
jgi:flagellar hook protein FlgE